MTLIVSNACASIFLLSSKSFSIVFNSRFTCSSLSSTRCLSSVLAASSFPRNFFTVFFFSCVLFIFFFNTSFSSVSEFRRFFNSVSFFRVLSLSSSASFSNCSIILLAPSFGEDGLISVFAPCVLDKDRVLRFVSSIAASPLVGSDITPSGVIEAERRSFKAAAADLCHAFWAFLTLSNLCCPICCINC